MIRSLVLSILILASTAEASPWSSRWTVVGRRVDPSFPAPYTVTLASSLAQVSAQPAVAAVSLAGQVITRATGSFIGDGYQVGQTITVTGSSSGNNQSAQVLVVAALTLTTSRSWVTEAALTVSGQPKLSASALMIWHTGSATQYNAMTRGRELQIDIQSTSGASANALSLRTQWTATYAEETGLSVAYPYHARFSSMGDASVDPLGSVVDYYFADPAAWAALPGPSTTWFVDFGSCNSTCQSNL
jgi:hypothetical protein